MSPRRFSLPEPVSAAVLILASGSPRGGEKRWLWINEALTVDPVNWWAGTLIPAVALDLSRQWIVGPLDSTQYSAAYALSEAADGRGWHQEDNGVS